MNKLEKMLNYISKYNSFYKKIIQEYGITNPLDITQYPVITRELVQSNNLEMFSDDFYEKYYMQKLIHFKSSGTSGIPIDIYWDSKDYNISMLELWRARKKTHNILPTSKKLCFSPINPYSTNDNKKMCVIKDNQLTLCRASFFDEKNKKTICDIIDEFSPIWIYGQPSYLSKLVSYYDEQNRQPVNTIQYIECVGEILSNHVRQSIQKTFGIAPTNMYGSTEMNCIGYEINKKMKILPNVYVEIMNDTGIHKFGEGSAIITNLCNFSMPLIRYNQGDLIKKNNTNKEIEIIEGRMSDLIYHNGKNITVGFLIELCERVNNIVSNIIVEYYFTYHIKMNKLICYMRLKEQYYDWSKRVEQIFIYYWHQYNLNIDLKIVFVSQPAICLENKQKLLVIENN